MKLCYNEISSFVQLTYYFLFLNFTFTKHIIFSFWALPKQYGITTFCIVLGIIIDLGAI